MAYQERVHILNEAEQQDFYGIPSFTSNDQRYFFALNDEERAVARKIRDRSQRCMFVLLLGYFKAKPVALKTRYHLIKADLRYIGECILPGPGHRPFNLAQKETARLYGRIYLLCGYERWDSGIHEDNLRGHLREHANLWSDSRYLFDMAIEYLAAHKVVIPGYSTLQKLIGQILVSHYDRLRLMLDLALSSDATDAILSIVTDDTGALSLRELRQSARNFNKAELAKELAVHQYMKDWVSDVESALKLLLLSPKNQQHYAARVDHYGAKLKRQSSSNQRLYLLCYLQQRWEKALERIADGLVHHIRKTHEAARRVAQESVYNDWRKAQKNLSKAAHVLCYFLDESIKPQQSFGGIRDEVFEVINRHDLESLCLFLKDQRRSVDEAAWQFYDTQDNLCRELIRPLFLCLRFEGQHGGEPIARQLHQAQNEFIERGALSQSDGYNLPSKQRRFLEDNEGNINLDRYEWHLYLQIPSRINGKLTLPDVAKYRALEADLISTEHWTQNREVLIEQTQLPKLSAEPRGLIRDMEQSLASRLLDVSSFLTRSDNRNVVLRNPKGKRLWRLPAGKKATVVNNPFFQQLPPTSIANVLRMVDRETGFIDAFRHVSGGASNARDHEQDLLAILVGNATNQGTYGICQVSDRSYEQLSTIQANYLRLNTLEAANDRVNNDTAKLPIFKYYSIQVDAIHASADGQKFEAKRETFKTRYSSKYFGTQKGVSAMSMIANHTAVNARVIGANEHESHYIFDLLYSNTSEIQPDVLSTDTHGVNHVNFALLDLFGYNFAPRYAQVGRVINEMFDTGEDKGGAIQLWLRAPINVRCIERHWDTIQRIVVSLKERRTTQAVLVRKLSGYKRNHPLLEALTEYNRLIKASYLLRYIDDAELRNHVQRALNRGEAYHQLRRAISDVSGDRFRGNSDDEIQLWNECARLVTNAIIYFNSNILSRLLKSFEQQNDDEKLAIVTQASPVAWHNINLKGRYSFESTDKMPDLDEMMQHIEGYRPVH